MSGGPMVPRRQMDATGWLLHAVGTAVIWMVVSTARLVFAGLVTLVWLAGWVGLLSILPDGWLGFVILVVAALVTVATLVVPVLLWLPWWTAPDMLWRWRWVRHCAPVLGDWLRHRRRMAGPAARRAYEAMGLLPNNFDGHVRGRLTQTRTCVVLEGPPPTGRVDVDVLRVAAERMAPSWAAVETVVTEPRPGLLRVEWWRVPRPDSLAAGVTLTTPLVADDFRSVPYGVGEDGLTRTLDLRNTSGAVVGGVPGGGKTAALTTLMAALVPRPDVQLVVIDGKGGSDWSWIAPRASVHWVDDEDLDGVLNVMTRVHDEMRHRLQTMKSVTGNSNIWHSGPTPEMPLLVILVDECQTFFDTKGLPKDRKATADAIAARCTSLVKKGRSAGILVISTTQKPTSDSIPTALRDNSALRICFRVMTPEAEASVLGDRGEPSATAIGASLPGMAIVATETGERERVRFSYLPEDTAEAWARQHAHLRRDLPEKGTTDD